MVDKHCMKNAFFGFLLASLALGGLPSAYAKGGVGPDAPSVDYLAKARSDFEKESNFYLTRVEDLRALAVNEGLERAPVSRLRDQSLDGSPKKSDLPAWFVSWHEASNGGSSPNAKAAIAVRDKFLLGRMAAKASGTDGLDREGLSGLLGQINSFNRPSIYGESKACSKITGCVVVGEPSVLGSSASRASVKRPVYDSAGGGAEGAGTGMDLLHDAH